MYQPAHFREERVTIMHELMRAHPFACLISMQDGQPTADHLPMAIHPEASGRGTLRAHIAKANPLWGNRDSLQTALAIFQGPQAYVTPSWYPSKYEHGKVVPTWNYTIVHARGPIEFIDDPQWLMAHLTEITTRQEQSRDLPWAVTDAPDDFMARQMRGIVGVEIVIDELEGKWKVSQNKDAADRAGVVSGLTTVADSEPAAVGKLMETYRPAQD